MDLWQMVPEGKKEKCPSELQPIAIFKDKIRNLILVIIYKAACILETSLHLNISLQSHDIPSYKPPSRLCRHP